MSHVLVLTLVFPPDGVSTAVIVGELAADLRQAGHDVTVVTTAPHYNRDAEAEAKQPLTRLWGALLYRSELHGIGVLHVGMPRKSGRVLSRLLAWIWFHALSLVAALTLVRRVDVILAPSPPLTNGICAWLLGRAYGAPFIYNVQELYPDIAVALGAIKNPRIISALLALERFVYARARLITVIGEGMRRRIIAKGVPTEKVRLIPNFVDVGYMQPLSKDNPFSRQHGLVGSFVVTYAGNMGPAQGLRTILDAAALLADEPGLLFLLVGEGSQHAELKATAQAKQLANVMVLPHHPYELVPQIYAASDLCVVPLAGQTGADAIPSKVYRIMACERAVLACTDADSDLGQLVTDARCGVVVPPGSADALAKAVVEIMRTPVAAAAMGRAGRAHVLAHYSRAAVSAQYKGLVGELTRGHPAR